MEKGAEFLAGLRALGQLQEVNGLWYNQKSISLDGYRFVGCRFDSCSIHIATTNFEFINCYIDEKTIITYGPSPLKVLKLYNSRNEFVYSKNRAFAPERSPDGTISIKGV